MIIISTVRSSQEFVEYDLKHTLGFVANPRRFNGKKTLRLMCSVNLNLVPVAVTRAQALLIIVGDPSVLSLDPLWRSFLNYCHVNGGWKGPPPSWNTREVVDEQGKFDKRLRELGLADMNEFTRRIESLTLAGVEGVGDDQEQTDANIDRPWVEVE